MSSASIGDEDTVRITWAIARNNPWRLDAENHKQMVHVPQKEVTRAGMLIQLQGSLQHAWNWLRMETIFEVRLIGDILAEIKRGQGFCCMAKAVAVRGEKIVCNNNHAMAKGPVQQSCRIFDGWQAKIVVC